MKKILFGLGIAVSIAAAIFSNSLKTKFVNALDERKATEGKIATTDVAFKKESETFVARNDELTAAKNKKSDADAKLETAKTRGNTLRRDLTTAQGELDTQKATLVKLEEVRKRIEEMIGGAGVRIEEIPERIAKLEDDLKSREKKSQELVVLIEGAKTSLEKNREEVSRLADRKAQRDSLIRRNARESVVTAVNNDWGFVVIGAGTNDGFAPQTELLVKRGGTLIGKVKPSAVEANQTIAEINAETMQPGARIQPGDLVIFADTAN